jgi:hypothetical protein
LTEGDECSEEFERERTAEDVVFIAYGCAFGKIVGCFLLDIGAIGGPEDTVVFVRVIMDGNDGLVSMARHDTRRYLLIGNPSLLPNFVHMRGDGPTINQSLK